MTSQERLNILMERLKKVEIPVIEKVPELKEVRTTDFQIETVICPFFLQNDRELCIAKQKLADKFVTKPTRSRKRKSTYTYRKHSDDWFCCPTEGVCLHECFFFEAYAEKLERMKFFMSKRDRGELEWVETLHTELLSMKRRI